MNDAPLLQTQNPELIHRGYNVALKLVPNLVGQMTVKQLEYLETNPPELANAAKRALLIQNRVGVYEPQITIPNLCSTGPTLADWLKAREELHKFFTDETVILRDIFALTDEELASTSLMPAFRPAGATNRMAVEWKKRMGVSVYEETNVMRYNNSKGPKAPELYIINRSVRPDEDTLDNNAKSPDGLVAVPNKLWLGLFGGCDADTLHFVVTEEHLDPKTATWFPYDRLPGGEVAYGRWYGGRVKFGWDDAGCRGPGGGARSAKKVPLRF